MNGCVIPGTSIAVDFWQVGRLAGVKLFFLTHLHGDHVVGLTSSWRQPLYCSPVTAQLLRQRYGLDASVIRTLAVGQAHLIHCCPGHCVRTAAGVQNHPSAPQSTAGSGCDFVSVTPVDANHCAGAVMFLFEGRFGKILHTGDFRYSEEMFEEGSPLSKHIGTIDVVYLDNTYCSPNCVFPSRGEVVNQIMDVVKSHEDCDVVFGVRGLGKEELLAAVALAVGDWVNVPPATLSFVTALGFPNVFQTGHPEACLRVIPFNTVSKDFVRKLNQNKPTVVILPTALYQGIGGKPYANVPEVFVVPYSDHSSYPELVQFVSRLKPCCVKPIVHGKVRGPFGVDVSSREDMSCFRKYLTKPPPPHPAASASDLSSVDNCSTAPQPQKHCTCGFENLFPDFQGRSSKRKKSVNRAPRKTLCPKGVNYISDDDQEEKVSPKKSRKTEKNPVVHTEEKPSTPGQASLHRQDKQKQNTVCLQGTEKKNTPAVSLKKAVDGGIRNKTGKNMSDEDSQRKSTAAVLPEDADTGRTVDNAPSKNKALKHSEFTKVGAKELQLLLPQCDSDRRTVCKDSSTSKSTHHHHVSFYEGPTPLSSQSPRSFKKGHKSIHPPTNTQTGPTHTKRKTEGCQSPVHRSWTKLKTSVEVPATSQGSVEKHPSIQPNTNAKSQAQGIESVSALIESYLLNRNGGKADVSGKQQRAKLMHTYHCIFGPRHVYSQETS